MRGLAARYARSHSHPPRFAWRSPPSRGGEDNGAFLQPHSRCPHRALSLCSASAVIASRVPGTSMADQLKPREVKIRVHDGVEIAVALYMTAGEGAFPAALAAAAA